MNFTLETERIQIVVMGESVRLEGFRASELEEIFEWFAGAVEVKSSDDFSFIIRIVRCDLSIGRNDSEISSIRHRASLRRQTLFLDGSVFDQQSQIRDVSIVSEGSGVACHLVDGGLLLATRGVAVVLGSVCPRMLLSDILENWLLWRAREAGQVMAHASGWIRDGKVEMMVGSSGDGKTTELLRQVEAGARYFANDRIALRTEGEVLLGRSFPEPINIGIGSIRSLGLDFPTFGLDDSCAVRLLAAEVATKWKPDFGTWYPVVRVYARDRASYEKNIYWEADPDHPFWNRALPARDLTERQTIEPFIMSRLSYLGTTGGVNSPGCGSASAVGGRDGTLSEAARAELDGAHTSTRHGGHSTTSLFKLEHPRKDGARRVNGQKGGQVRALVIGSTRGEDLVEVSSIQVLAGQGIIGDRYFRDSPYGDASRDLTLIQWEALEELHRAYGLELSVTQARRNIVTVNVDLKVLVGRRFRIGSVDCIGIKTCPPCIRLERLTVPGVLRGLAYTGGLRAAIVSDGVICVGENIVPLA